MKVYSFKDLSGALSDPDVGDFILAGQIGEGQVTIAMSIEKTVHDVSSDGTVMPSFISGDNGQVSIEVQQTSDLHTFLLGWYNTKKTAADNGDVSTYAATTLTLRSTTDSSTHVAQGVSPSKLPDKVYTAQGQRLTWVLMCADIQSSTL
jgi:hypothetical protein